ncbi:VOC family protein [Ramlibacter sp. AW1]|uniref:VOC family protein n=1 Tax=Ramlibacter aurantiacus TaxID=2801330 RepID=A0A936ZL40_9BURK|nr:VOC family protein [Ramlibacter aurantiacus]MBL0419283.1 VOC family protein [Ramlibacter aurantiacus]
MDVRICIDVDDLERGITFYTQGLGLRVGRRFDSEWVELIGGSSPIDLLVNAGGTAPLGPPHTQRRTYARHWTPVHLDFVVQGIDEFAKRLVALGATLERPMAHYSWGLMASMADPFGHGLDLLELSGRGYDELMHAKAA